MGFSDEDKILIKTELIQKGTGEYGGKKTNEYREKSWSKVVCHAASCLPDTNP